MKLLKKRLMMKRQLMTSKKQRLKKNYQIKSTAPNLHHLRQKLVKKQMIRERQTKKQKACVLKHLKREDRSDRALKKQECQELKEKYDDLLKNKSWQKIKALVFNEQKNNSKQFDYKVQFSDFQLLFSQVLTVFLLKFFLNICFF